MRTNDPDNPTYSDSRVVIETVAAEQEVTDG